MSLTHAHTIGELWCLTDEQIARFWTKFERRGPGDCWPWLRARSRGYGVVGFTTPLSGHRNHVATKVSLFLRTGEAPGPGEVVMHLCDNPPCVNPAHLRIATPKDNHHDMLRKGRWRSRAPWDKRGTKLTAQDAHEIREARLRGATNRRIAAVFGVANGTIQRVLLAKRFVSR